MNVQEGDKYRALKPMGNVVIGEEIEITFVSGFGICAKSDIHPNISFSHDDFDEDDNPDQWEKIES